MLYYPFFKMAMTILLSPLSAIFIQLHISIVIASRFLCYFLQLFLFKNLSVKSLSFEVSLPRLLPFLYVMDYASSYLINFIYLLSYI